MDKYFKNEKAMTAEGLLKMYENHRWSDWHPHLHPQVEAFKELVSECEEPPLYREYLEKVKAAEEKMSPLKNDINDIVRNKERIILKNSEEEYKQILKKLQAELRPMEHELSNIKYKKPKNKFDILEPIYEAIKKMERKADENFWKAEKEKRNDPDYYY